MYKIQVMYDSYITEEEERMIEVALEEVTELFPSLWITVLEPNRADQAVDSAFSEDTTCRKNAVDILKKVNEYTGKNKYTIFFTSERLFAPVSDVAASNVGTKYALEGIGTDNIALHSLAEMRPYGLEHEMYKVEHLMCYIVANLVFGLESGCEEQRCLMHKTKTLQEDFDQVMFEEHGEHRLCPKCREEALGKISISDRLTDSFVEYNF